MKQTLYFFTKRHAWSKMVCMLAVGSIILISSQSHLRKNSLLLPSGVMIDEDGVCVNTLPYGKLHDLRPKEVKNFQKLHIERAGGEPYDKDPPKYHILPPGSSVAYWNCKGNEKKCIHPEINGINVVKGSAWTSDGVDAFDEKDEKYAENNPKRIWVPYEKYEFLATKKTVLTGDAVAMFGFIPFNFGHCLHDNLPLVAWLRSIVPETTTFILPDTEIYRNLIDFIDPTFSQRIYYYKRNEVVTVEEGTLTVAEPIGLILAPYGNTLFRHFRHWVAEHHEETYYPSEEKFVIFHTRGGPEAAHGRKIDPQHEQDILNKIYTMMKKYNRKEKLVIFSGVDDNGNRLSYQQQMDIFRHASTIIGPHGSGLANVMWTNPFPKECDKRVQMLEFVPGIDSAIVQSPLYNGYYWVMRGMPVDWNQILYAGNSTADTTFIDFSDLEHAIDSMWG
jgi:hypothetical protein